MFYLAIGILFAIGGPMWPVIRTRIPGAVAASFTRAALDVRFLIVALLLVFVYAAVGPEIYRRFTEPSPAQVNADEIATAVIAKLPQFSRQLLADDLEKVTAPLRAQLSTLTQQLNVPRQSPVPPPRPPFVSPLHEPHQKWDFAAGIRSSIQQSGLTPQCQITIVRLQVPFAEDYANDFKEILTVIGWKFDEQFATRSVDKDVSVRAIDKPGPSKDCANAISNRLRNIAKRRSGSTINAPERWLTEAEAPEYLKQCSSACIEVQFGNEGE
jgi:hypothetical protein